MMHQRYSLNSKVLILVLLIVSLAGRAGAQEWVSNYSDGQEALKKGKYKEAISLFSKAIAQRPESKADARTHGVQFIDYFPYVYRGLAYAQLGNRANALKDFEREQSAGEVFKGRRDTDAGKLLRKRMEEVRAGTTAREVVSESSQKAGLDSLFTAAARALEEGSVTRSKALLLELKKRSPTYAGLDPLLARIRSLEQDVRKGIAAFLNGQYREAVESLTLVAARWTDNVNVHAFLGCSHAALYLLSGEKKEGEKEKALETFRRVKALDSGFELNRTYVSPAIQEMFASVRADGRAKGSNP